MKKYSDMSNGEIIDECRGICIDSYTEKEAIEAIKTKFGYTPSIYFSQPNSAGQKMVTGEISGPRGDTISFWKAAM